MPRLRCLLVAFVLAAPALAAAQGQWSQLDTGPGSGGGFSRHDDIEGVSPETLYVSGGASEGSRPTLYRTFDGGDTWASFFQPVDGYPRSLAFVSGTHGFLGTLTGGPPADALYETTDGGVTLTPITDRITGPLPDGLCGLFALDGLAVYGVGSISGDARFLRTLDGGQTWTSLDLSALATVLVDVYFFDRQHGLAVGGRGSTTDTSTGRVVVLGTDDGGATWTERFVGPRLGEWGWKLFFPTAQTGYVAIERVVTPIEAHVLKTTDRGQTWSELTVPGFWSMQGIGFASANRGWFGGRGAAAATTDGGATWTPFTGLDQLVNRFVFFGDTLGYAVGQRVHRYRGSEPTATAPPPPATPPAFTAGPAYPNPFPRRVLLPFTLPAPAEVSLEVFDALGRRVARVDYGRRGAGPDELLWEGVDEGGRPLAAGAYVYRLRAGALEATGQFVKAAPAY